MTGALLEPGGGKSHLITRDREWQEREIYANKPCQNNPYLPSHFSRITCPSSDPMFCQLFEIHCSLSNLVCERGPELLLWVCYFHEGSYVHTKLLNKICMLFSCSSVLCLILRLSQRPKRTEERFCLQMWGQPRGGCRDTDVDRWSPWERAGGGKTMRLERVHGASFVTSRSEKPGRGNSPTVPFRPYLEKYLFFFFFFLLHPETCEILVPWARIQPTPLQWKHRVLVMGSQGSPWKNIFIPSILSSLLILTSWKPP